MKPLTKKQRREIYLKAAESVLTEANCCCYALYQFGSQVNGSIKLNNAKEIICAFPEFGLFKPETRTTFWFPCNPEGDYERIICMLFCAEMCKP